MPPHSSHERDLALARAALAKDRRSVEVMARRLRCVPRILNAANRRLGRRLDSHDIEDLAQEVVTVILQKLETFNGTSTLESWVHGICHYQLMNRIRRRARDSQMETNLPDDPPADPGAVRQDDPFEEELLRNALDALPDEEAEVVRCKHFDDLSFTDMGEKLGISPNTAKSRYYRAISTLRQRLGPSVSDEERNAS